MKKTAVLLLHCEDRQGIVAEITDFLVKNNGNIVGLKEHVDEQLQHFFMRIEWEIEGFQIEQDKIAEIFKALFVNKFKLSWSLNFKNRKPRIAIMVSKHAHCFLDIMARVEAGEWQVEIPLIISNHEKFAYIGDRYDIPYYHIPITKTTKQVQEAQEIKLLQEHNIDLIVMARYMQILSSKFINSFPLKIINIHHSSLPAFVGADPYKAAYDRGVKILGATAHYATVDLDEGPIITQDVIPITHIDSIKEMKRKGKDIEKIVLAKAVWAHINHRIISYKNKTVVFA